MSAFQFSNQKANRAPWNKGKLAGQRRPLKLKEIWGIRIRLQKENRVKDLALFNLTINTKLRGWDFISLLVADVTRSGRVMSRASVMQQKTLQPVQFEITRETQDFLTLWISAAKLEMGDYLFPSRISNSPYLSTRQYTWIGHQWFESIGLDLALSGTHSLRRTKATLIYRRTKNLRAVQLLLGHTKPGSTVRQRSLIGL